MTASEQHLLEVEGLTVDFHSADGAFRAVEDVSFHVDPGETLVILGESGSGKSVSVSVIMELLDTPPGEIVTGRVAYKGRPIARYTGGNTPEINGRDIAMIFQDPLSHLNPVYSVGWQIAEVFRAHGVARGREARRRAVEILERVGIDDAERRYHQYPHQFSGGQRQRIMIGMAIALRPSVLIADEPTTALDVSVQVQILGLLKRLQQEDGLALILITHDLALAASIADRVIVMNRGRIVEAGAAREVLSNPQHAYTRKLVAAVPRPGDEATVADAPRRDPLLEVRNLTKDYVLSSGLFAGFRDLRAVDDVSFTLGTGETLGIVGESGSGKSTVARILMRLTGASSGTALYRGADILRMGRRELQGLRRRVQMVFQDPYSSLNPRMDVFAIVSEPWRIHRDILPPARWRERAAELLELVGLEPAHLARYPHQFSGGQRQRIAIARALASDPELVICDEAVSALDASVQMQVIDLLSDLRERLGLSYIFISHDLPVVRHFADRIVVMKSGEAVEQGPVEDIFRRPRHPYTLKLLNATPRPKWDPAPTLESPSPAAPADAGQQPPKENSRLCLP